MKVYSRLDSVRHGSVAFVFALMMMMMMPAHLNAEATLLVGEPYGKLGSVSPTGHAAVYLDHICSAFPTTVRRCEPGERGVVISRYNGIGGFDWIAIPLIPYLYAVEYADQVPDFADKAAVDDLRDAYRRTHLYDLLPDAPEGEPPGGDWVQLVGAAYDRLIVAFRVATTEEQDDELIRILNARENTARFNFFLRNCADFARDIFNFYYPDALRKSVIADLGLATPKQVAKSLVQFGKKRADVEVSAFMVLQIPGSRPSSRSPRGVLESLVKTKKYLIPLILVQPWVPAVLAGGYVATGRFNLKRQAAVVLSPSELEEVIPRSANRPAASD